MVATSQKVTHPVRVTADYDRDADVMYVALGSPVSPSGATIIGFSRHRWDEDLCSLSHLIGRHLKVDAANARLALDTAI
jgi:hypothetical protein